MSVARSGITALLYSAVSSIALAQTVGAADRAASPDAQPAREEVVVIGVAPLPGSGISADKMPSNTETLSAADVSREGQASFIRTISNNLGSVSINDSLNDSFQPDIVYRGFTASPVLGTSEGLAVYQNGVRINEAFGDTVNWDLFPDIAINRITVIGSNPVFGLNALGGALNVEMKSGFTYQGGEAEISGGSFGQRNFSAQYGKQFGDWAVYAAGRVLNEDGWREFSPDSVQQLYADLAKRGDKYAFDISFTGANNLLQGPGATPVQELAISRSLVFTSPQNFRNQVEFVALNGSYDLTDQLAVQSNFFYREFRQSVANGNTTNNARCINGSGLCDRKGKPLIGPNGMQIADISNNSTVPIGENNEDATRTVGLGGSLQVTDTGQVFGYDNHLVAGASIDHGATDYQAITQLGVISPLLVVEPSGLFIAEPDSSAGPIGLTTTNSYYGTYITDTFDVTADLAVTASGRFNVAQIHLMDHLGTALNGNARYNRFNPALGATYKLLPNVTVYGGYSESNRAPTAGELACSNPLKPCILPAFLSSDPPDLSQVVAHTWEAGLRGNFTLPDLTDGQFTWKAGLYRTDLHDDIISITSALSLNQGYFQNAGSTRRQGLDTSISFRDQSWSIYLNYSFVDATFQSPLSLSSGAPTADANGNIHVVPGDHLPGVPQHRIKAGADYQVTPAWTIGGSLNYVSAQYFANDQSNQNPQLPGHVVVNFHTSYQVTDTLELFGEADNAFDARYSTFALFGDPTGVGAPGVPTNGVGVDPRFESPAPPIGVFAGVRLKF